MAPVNPGGHSFMQSPFSGLQMVPEGQLQAFWQVSPQRFGGHSVSHLEPVKPTLHSHFPVWRTTESCNVCGESVVQQTTY